MVVRDLKAKEKILVEYLLQGDSLTTAVKKAGYGSYIQNKPSSVFDKPSVQKAFRSALIEAGIEDRRLVHSINEGLKAMKYIVLNGNIEERPDHATRHKFLETAIRVLGLNPEEDHSVTVETYEQKLLRLAGRSTT